MLEQCKIVEDALSGEARTINRKSPLHGRICLEQDKSTGSLFISSDCLPPRQPLAVISEVNENRNGNIPGRSWAIDYGSSLAFYRGSKDEIHASLERWEFLAAKPSICPVFSTPRMAAYYIIQDAMVQGRIRRYGVFDTAKTSKYVEDAVMWDRRMDIVGHSITEAGWDVHKIGMYEGNGIIYVITKGKDDGIYDRIKQRIESYDLKIDAMDVARRGKLEDGPWQVSVALSEDEERTEEFTNISPEEVAMHAVEQVPRAKTIMLTQKLGDALKKRIPTFDALTQGLSWTSASLRGGTGDWPILRYYMWAWKSLGRTKTVDYSPEFMARAVVEACNEIGAAMVRVKPGASDAVVEPYEEYNDIVNISISDIWYRIVFGVAPVEDVSKYDFYMFQENSGRHPEISDSILEEAKSVDVQDPLSMQDLTIYKRIISLTLEHSPENTRLLYSQCTPHFNEGLTASMKFIFETSNASVSPMLDFVHRAMESTGIKPYPKSECYVDTNGGIVTICIPHLRHSSVLKKYVYDSAKPGSLDDQFTVICEGAPDFNDAWIERTLRNAYPYWDDRTRVNELSSQLAKAGFEGDIQYNTPRAKEALRTGSVLIHIHPKKKGMKPDDVYNTVKPIIYQVLDAQLWRSSFYPGTYSWGTYLSKYKPQHFEENEWFTLEVSVNPLHAVAADRAPYPIDVPISEAKGDSEMMGFIRKALSKETVLSIPREIKIELNDLGYHKGTVTYVAYASTGALNAYFLSIELWTDLEAFKKSGYDAKSFVNASIERVRQAIDPLLKSKGHELRRGDVNWTVYADKNYMGMSVATTGSLDLGGTLISPPYRTMITLHD